MGKGLVAAAQSALAAPTFDERNAIHADAVARVATPAALYSANVINPAARSHVFKVFHEAALEAGGEFKEGGGGASAAGPIAFKSMPKLLHAVSGDEKPLGIEQRMNLQAKAASIVTKATVDDIAMIVAHDLGLKEPPVAGKALVDAIAAVTPESDYFHAAIPNIKVRAPGHAAMAEPDRQVLNLGIRLANVTWKSGQVHRAVTDPTRIDPDKREGVYNPYDILKAKSFTSSTDPKAGFAKAVFQVYKDLIELQNAAK